MRCNGAIFLGSVLLMLTASSRAQDVRVVPLFAAKSTSKFQCCQWSIDVGHVTGNPFNPADIAVDAVFSGPSGKTLTIPAFWDSPEGGNAALSQPGFQVRFAPPEAGTWSCKVTVVQPSGSRVSEPITFGVADRAADGFIRRAANNHYLRYDSGKSYFPVGINLCWAGANVDPAQWYEDSFKNLSANGVNYVRVWMCHPDAMLESPATGLGKYNLRNALLFDRILSSAQDHGIGVMLCMMNHRELLEKDMWGPAGWGSFPYNAQNAGPATRPIDFFTSPEAREAFKNRLRYIVARYSAFTSVAFWELFNEEEFAQVEIPVEWNGEMSTYLRRIDPATHLITTSANVPADVWRLPDMDLTQAHPYGDGTEADRVTPIAASYSEAEQFNKPHLIGEAGLDSKGSDLKFDPSGKGTDFHNALWAPIMSGDAGSGIYWWWDNYVGEKDLWHEFKPVAQFTSAVDWGGKYFKPVAITQLWHADANPGNVDLTLLPAGGWGTTCKNVITIPGNGRAGVSIPHYLYAPKQAKLYSPMIFDINLPAPTELILHVDQVSDFDVVRVSIDDNPIKDLDFSALPGTPGIRNTKYLDGPKLYQGDLDQKFTLALPGGHHRIKIDNIAGDWITLSQITFSNSLDAKYENLAGYCVQDAASHETLVWILNTRSNWKDDQSQESPPVQKDVRLLLPGIQSGSFTARWTDTRSGKMIGSDEIDAAGGKLVLKVPPFDRDIALCLQSRIGISQALLEENRP